MNPITPSTESANATTLDSRPMKTTTLSSEPLASLLAQMFLAADAPADPQLRAAITAMGPAERDRISQSTVAEDYQRFYRLAKGAYLAVSRETAHLLYMLVRATRPASIVEFGTSFGVSTLHLAAGLRDNGAGRLITAEFEPSKAAQARESFASAGLDDLIELREGDAVTTLASGLPAAIDLVLMDGAKGLYPVVLDLLEPHLAPGALIVADNADASPEYLARVRSHEGGYVSVPFAEDVELSLRAG